MHPILNLGSLACIMLVCLPTFLTAGGKNSQPKPGLVIDPGDTIKKDSVKTKYVYKVVEFGKNLEQSSRTLNELAKRGWEYVGPLTANSVAFRRPLRILRIRTYDFVLPWWWDDVTVNAPARYLNSDREETMRAYIRKEAGKDVGTPDTWKLALKLWALWCQKNEEYPSYLGHCFKAGRQYERAIEVYTATHRMGMGKDNAWRICHSAYNIGECYFILKQYSNAKRWYQKSAKYINSADQAIQYYAEVSAKRVAQIDKLQ